MQAKWVGKVIGVAAVVCALGTPDAGAQTLVEGCHAVVVPAAGGGGARSHAPVVKKPRPKPSGGGVGGGGENVYIRG